MKQTSKFSYLIGATFLIIFILSSIFVFKSFTATEFWYSISIYHKVGILFLTSGVLTSMIFGGLAIIYAIIYCIGHIKHKIKSR